MDEADLIGAGQAGTATRPPRVQGRQPDGVEGVDDIADGVFVRGHEPGDGGHRGAAGRRHDDQCPAEPYGVLFAAAHNAEQGLAFLVGQSAGPDRRACHQFLPVVTDIRYVDVNDHHGGNNPVDHNPRNTS